MQHLYKNLHIFRACLIKRKIQESVENSMNCSHKVQYYGKKISRKRAISQKYSTQRNTFKKRRHIFTPCLTSLQIFQIIGFKLMEEFRSQDMYYRIQKLTVSKKDHNSKSTEHGKLNKNVHPRTMINKVSKFQKNRLKTL